MSSLNVGGAGRAQWPERDWPVSSRKTEIERVDSIEKVVDDRRSLGPLASGVARYTSPTAAQPGLESVNGYDHLMDSLRAAALKRDAALAGGSDTAKPRPAAVAEEPATDKPPTVNEFGEAYVRNAIAQYQRNSNLTPALT
jgi:hypothetical protein